MRIDPPLRFTERGFSQFLRVQAHAQSNLGAIGIGRAHACAHDQFANGIRFHHAQLHRVVDDLQARLFFENAHVVKPGVDVQMQHCIARSRAAVVRQRHRRFALRGGGYQPRTDTLDAVAPGAQVRQRADDDCALEFALAGVPLQSGLYRQLRAVGLRRSDDCLRNQLHRFARRNAAELVRQRVILALAHRATVDAHSPAHRKQSFRQNERHADVFRSRRSGIVRAYAQRHPAARRDFGRRFHRKRRSLVFKIRMRARYD